MKVSCSQLTTVHCKIEKINEEGFGTAHPMLDGCTSSHPALLWNNQTCSAVEWFLRLRGWIIQLWFLAFSNVTLDVSTNSPPPFKLE